MMDDRSRVEVFDACVYDLCLARRNVTCALCENINAFVSRCVKEFKVETNSWRSPEMCRRFFVSITYCVRPPSQRKTKYLQPNSHMRAAESWMSWIYDVRLTFLQYQFIQKYSLSGDNFCQNQRLVSALTGIVTRFTFQISYLQIALIGIARFLALWVHLLTSISLMTGTGGMGA